MFFCVLHVPFHNNNNNKVTLSRTSDKTAAVKSGFDADSENILATASPRASNIAAIMAADKPRCENNRVAVVKAGTRQL